MRTKQTAPIPIRLSANDLVKFDAQCFLKEKSRSELAREAIRFWLAHQENSEHKERESLVEQRLRKMEDHMAGLLVKLGIDVNTLYFMLWDRSDPQTRMPLWEAYRTKATERFCKPLKGRDKEAKQVVVDHISGEE